MTPRSRSPRAPMRRACAGACLLAILATLALAGATCAQTPWGADYFPNVPLTTQDGATVHFYDDLLKGKSVVINLFYTSCTNTCPLETAKLAQVQKLFGTHMGRDVYFYSIAIDPWDTPAEMKAYARKFDVGPGWLFLAGKPDDVKLIAHKLGLKRAGEAAGLDGHSPSLAVGKVPEGMWMRQSAVDNPQFLAAQIGDFLRLPAVAPATDYAAARPLDIGQGEAVFRSACSACHTVGGGDRVGPDLQGVAQRRSHAWLMRFIAAPDRVRAEGDAVALDLYERYNRVAMPNLRLGDADIGAVLEYIQGKSAAAPLDPGAGVARGQ